MAITYLKKADPRPAAENNDIRDVFSVMLTNIEREGEEAVRRYAEQLDGCTGDIVLSDEARQAACERVSQDLKDDIEFAHGNIRLFAEAQKPPWANARSKSFPA